MMSRTLRLALIVAAGIALAIALIGLVTVHLLLQPERFTAMLQNQARAGGLELSLAKPASPSLFPRPALELQGLTLNAPGATAPILVAANGRLALPWRTLFGGDTIITQMEIDSPRLDLDALQDWFDNLPPRPSTPLRIPRIDTGVLVTRGSILRGEELLFNDVTLEAGKLASGQPFPLSASARIANGDIVQLRLSATPRIAGDALQLDHIGLRLAQGTSLVLQLSGDARWHGASDAAVHLAGKLDHADAGSYDTAVTLTPANQTAPLMLTLKLDGPDSHADLQLPPVALADWWEKTAHAQQPPLALPPGTGKIDIGKINAAGISIEGLHLETGVAPASAASAAAPKRP